MQCNGFVHVSRIHPTRTGARVRDEDGEAVTHPLLASKAAPGQLTFVEIQRALHLCGLLPTRRFYLFGTPIAHSMSPTLHNTGFETPTVNEDIRRVIKEKEFGGASVTITDELSDAAKAIGAVNTIVPRDGGLYGENTDYLGIVAAVRGHASKVGFAWTIGAAGETEAALVIGAGGTARAAVYALKTLGVREVYVFNRTRAKAEAIATAFDDVREQGRTRVRTLETLDAWPCGPPRVIVSTVPADATTTTGPSTQAMYIPTTLFTAPTGVVVDMAYKPAETPLLRLAAETAPGWARVRGVEVLLEQGYVQFETWTGRQCPRDKVRERMLARYDRP